MPFTSENGKCSSFMDHSAAATAAPATVSLLNHERECHFLPYDKNKNNFNKSC